jgi:hypothetical protein
MSTQDIIERLESASGPDRELDIAILKATDANGYLIEDDGTILVECDMGEGPGWFNIGYEVPTFTAAIDAALTLVPDEYCWFITKGRAQVCGRLYSFHIFDPALQSVIAKSEGERLEICICIAALKARASISSKEQVGS